MTTYSFGDLILVPFPFTDQSASKKRPAIVISSRECQAQRGDLIIVAVTSQLRSSTPFDGLMVESWTEAGLVKPSAVKPVVATIAQSLVLKTLGTLDERDRHRLREWLSTLFG